MEILFASVEHYSSGYAQEARAKGTGGLGSDILDSLERQFPNMNWKEPSYVPLGTSGKQNGRRNRRTAMGRGCDLHEADG